MNRKLFQSFLNLFFFTFVRLHDMMCFIHLPSALEMQILKCLDPLDFNKLKN